jgi:hypothetical protein
MSCHHFQTANGTVTGVICLANIFRYKGFLFEHHRYLGPIPLRKDGEQTMRIRKGFYDAYTEFMQLDDKDKETFRICG